MKRTPFQITMLSHYPVLISIYPVIKTAMVSPGCRALADRVTRGKERTASRSSVRPSHHSVVFGFEIKFRHGLTKSFVVGFVAENGDLELRNVNAKDTGNYTCVMTYMNPDNEEPVETANEVHLQGESSDYRLKFIF